MAARAYVGTSGWNYKHWRELIYPKSLPVRSWLGFASREFDTLEVNTSFYAIPRRETIASWVAATPDTFPFALKMWRGITHYRKLQKTTDLTQRFLDVADLLPADRRAPLLIQMPPTLGPDVPRLRAYVEELRALAVSPWRLAAEFRHPGWLAPEIRREIDGMGVALCVHDMLGRGATDEPNEAPFVYMRRHGAAGGRYSGSYSPEELDRDAERILRWTAEGRDVYVYFNNDIGGHAFFNARELRARLPTFRSFSQGLEDRGLCIRT